MKATWYGSEPEAGAERHVELEVEGVLRWGHDIREEPAGAPAIAMDGDEVEITGQITSITDEGVADLRVGGALVTVETEGSPPAVGAFVRLRIPRLALYDERL